MNLYQSSKKMAAFFLIFILLSVIPLPLNGEDPQQLFSDGINQDDGIYYSYTFDKCNTSRCNISYGKVTLNFEESIYKKYDFKDWDINTQHRAYYFSSPFLFPAFFSIESFISFFNEKDLLKDDYKYIGSNDNVYYPIGGESSDSKSFCRMHHFRFKISQDEKTITSINGSGEWYGKFENESDIDIYEWMQFSSFIGYWKKLTAKLDQYPPYNPQKNVLYFNLSKNLSKYNNGYVDLCVVLTPQFPKKCRLFTDYITISVKGKEYVNDGYIQSPTVMPENISHWEFATWEDHKPSHTNITYQIFFKDKNGNNQLINDNILPGNSNGFYKEPIDLQSIPKTYNISLRARFKTTDSSVSPELYKWGFCWQNKENIWTDKFTSPMRLSKNDINNVIIESEQVSLLTSINNWPMFGHNPNNTRNTPSIGPGENDNIRQWYARAVAGGKQQNPIIQDRMLYITSFDGRKLLKYSEVLRDLSGSELPYQATTEELPFEIKTSPVATDNTVIVATASSKNGGEKNIIYGFDSLGQNGILEKKWEFKYEDSKPKPDNFTICYEASPVICNNRIYLTTWSGDSSKIGSILNLIGLSKGNNKVICLTDNGTQVWISSLPAGSYSSPAVTNDLVVVGCENSFGPSIFTFYTKDGKEKWNNSIGLFGYSSPVIYKGVVFAVSKTLGENLITVQTRLVALDLNTGKILWNISLWNTLITNEIYSPAYNSLVVANDIIYVISPEGDLYAFNYLTQKQLWKRNIYKGLFSTIDLTSSPAYANGILYIGTPAGFLYAINASNGKDIWSRSTEENQAIFSSPIVVDGLVFITTKGGLLEAIGDYQTAENQQAIGSIISRPITFPDDNNTYSWGRFSAETKTKKGYIKFSILDESNKILLSDVQSGASISSLTAKNIKTIRLKATFSGYTTGEVILYQWSVTYTNIPQPDTTFYDDTFIGNPPICSIQVRNDKVGLWNTSAKFKLQYYKSSGQQITDWLSANCTGINGSKAKEKILVNLSRYSSIKNVTRYESITFSIKDMNGNESVSKGYKFNPSDAEKPIFYLSSFEPASRNITTPTPFCTIKARDGGTSNNISGIDVSSAKFTIEYVDQVGIKTYTGKAQCTGINGTKNNVTLTVNISSLNFSKNIKDTNKIKFSIKDMANPPNENTTEWINLLLDNIKPTSFITNTNEIPKLCNTSPVTIKANASDIGSGVKEVSLQYKLKSSTQWLSFGSDSIPPYTWSFTIGADEGGEYELSSVAIDKAGNEEDRPSSPDVSFVFDPNDPSLPIFKGLYEFTSDDIPVFNDITFKDDYQLKQVFYRIDFEGIDEWTPLNTEDLEKPIFTPTWNLTRSQWDAMMEDQVHYIYFRLTDMLGNTIETPSNKALKLVKNLKNISVYDPDISDFDRWSWNNEYSIKMNIDDSQVDMMQLWFNYSTNETVGTFFSQYGANLTNGASSWTFIPDHGTGYYSFKVKVIDLQGQEHLSNVKTVYITVFPLMELMIFVLLLVVLLIVSVLIFRKFKKVTVVVED